MARHKSRNSGTRRKPFSKPAVNKLEVSKCNQAEILSVLPGKLTQLANHNLETGESIDPPCIIITDGIESALGFFDKLPFEAMASIKRIRVHIHKDTLFDKRGQILQALQCFASCPPARRLEDIGLSLQLLPPILGKKDPEQGRIIGFPRYKINGILGPDISFVVIHRTDEAPATCRDMMDVLQPNPRKLPVVNFLSRLPTELRLMIYRPLVPRKFRYCPSLGAKTFSCRCGPQKCYGWSVYRNMLLVCRQIQDEFFALTMETCKFVCHARIHNPVRYHHDGPITSDVANMFKVVGTRIASSFRIFEIRFLREKLDRYKFDNMFTPLRELLMAHAAGSPYVDPTSLKLLAAGKLIYDFHGQTRESSVSTIMVIYNHYPRLTLRLKSLDSTYLALSYGNVLKLL